MELQTIEQPLFLDLSPDGQKIARQFLAEMAKVGKSIRAMGKLLTEMDETDREKFAAAFPASQREVIGRILLVGMNQMAPEVAMIGGVAGKRLAALPVKDQERYVKELIPVAIREPDGTRNHRMMDPTTMGSATTKQVFRAAGTFCEVRSLEEQWAYIEEQERAARAKAHRRPSSIVDRADYRIEGGKFYPKGHLIEEGATARILRKALADMAE